MKVQEGILAAVLELNAKPMTFFPLGMVPHDSGQLFFPFIRDADGSTHRKILLHEDAQAMEGNILHIAELLQLGSSFLPTKHHQFCIAQPGL